MLAKSNPPPGLGDPLHTTIQRVNDLEYEIKMLWERILKLERERKMPQEKRRP